MARTTAFQGTKFYLGNGTDEAKSITGATVTPSATLTIATSGFEKGDCIEVTGLGALDGFYPVEEVSGNTVTLADEVAQSWADKDKPTKFTHAKAAKVQWSDNFCAIKNIEVDGDTIGEIDVTTMCSEGTETEPGEIEFGSLKLTFFYAPASTIQADLRKKYFSNAKFPYLIVFKNKQGSLYGTGFIQTSPNISGEVKGQFESGVTIKKAKRDYLLPVA